MNIFTPDICFFSQLANFDKNCNGNIMSSVTPILNRIRHETCQILSEIVKIENFGFDFEDTTEA